MAKVKFQLEMGGEKVRTLEQLREHFDIFEGMEYVENGKLVKWLKSQGEDELAETVSALDPQGTDCPKKLWRALGIAFDDQKYQLWDVLFRTSEGALGIAFNDQKYQQLLQIKRGEEAHGKVEEQRKRTIEAKDFMAYLSKMPIFGGRECTVKSETGNQYNKEGACHDETRKPKA